MTVREIMAAWAAYGATWGRCRAQQRLVDVFVDDSTLWREL